VGEVLSVSTKRGNSAAQVQIIYEKDRTIRAKVL